MNDPSNIPSGPTLTTLPAEIRLSIFDHVFDAATTTTATTPSFRNHNVPGGLVLNEAYTASTPLALLLTCRQFHADAHILALRRTPFTCTNLFTPMPDRLAVLPPKQQAAIRHIAFAADARHFRRFVDWKAHAFGMPDLQLETLTVCLHPSTPWHYLFDYTHDIVSMLRTLRNVKRLVFVRNGARVKGTFRTWYNRLVGLILKVDHQERYDRDEPRAEETWWEWEFDEMGQRICLEARPPKGLVGEGEYLEGVLPLMGRLRESIEGEEFNPDPRSRMMYY